MILRLAFLVALTIAQVAVTPPVLAQTEASDTLPDYVAWDRIATRIEAQVANSSTTSATFETLRADLVERRAAFLAGQGAGQSQINALISQIDALGPVPADGAAEAPEIAARRSELNAALSALQAPRLAADEAYRRADALIAQIDAIFRERQAAEFQQMWPAPVNPANWPAGWSALRAASGSITGMVAVNWSQPDRRAEVRERAPVIAGLVVVSLLLLTRARGWVEQLGVRIHARASARGRDVLATFVSLGQVVLPVLGMVALAAALRQLGLTGPRGTALIRELPTAALIFFAARWIGNNLFAKRDMPEPFLRLAPERRAEGRIYAALLGLLLGMEMLRFVAVRPTGETADAANAVLALVPLTLVGVLLFRLGQLFRLHVRTEAAAGEGFSIGGRLIGLVAQAAMFIGVVAPVFAAIGYVPAATLTLYPAAMTLGVVGMLLILQRLVGDIYALVSRHEDQARDALAPVLLGYALVVLAQPLLALIWGARVSDLAEVWNRFLEGFSFGATRISPASFATFVLLFAVGYALTRLFQGALRTSILPKTRIDPGGQTAILSGVGYVGIFAAALVAISAAGIDLSSFAIVAGALSVGIGFGLQNIVSNFVSGIILLIERPVSEGDWIEVGSVMGRVRAISVRSTRIETFDRTNVIVPNTDLVAGQVTNWTRFNLTGRLIQPVTVAFGSDTRKVERVLREIAEDQPLVVLNPRPLVLFTGMVPTGLSFELRVILRDVNFKLDVQSEINHEIVRRFTAEGIDVPAGPFGVTLQFPQSLEVAQKTAQQTLAAMPSPAAARDAEVTDPSLTENLSGTDVPAPPEPRAVAR